VGFYDCYFLVALSPPRWLSMSLLSSKDSYISGKPIYKLQNRLILYSFLKFLLEHFLCYFKILNYLSFTCLYNNNNYKVLIFEEVFLNFKNIF